MLNHYFKNHNANPKNKKVADCVIRAISFGTGKSWEDTFMGLVDIALKKKCVPNEKVAYVPYMEENGFNPRKIVLNEFRKKPTVNSFCRDNKKGTYVLSVANHLVVVKDGYFYDTWDCGDKTVYKYWERI